MSYLKKGRWHKQTFRGMGITWHRYPYYLDIPLISWHSLANLTHPWYFWHTLVNLTDHCYFDRLLQIWHTLDILTYPWYLDIPCIPWHNLDTLTYPSYFDIPLLIWHILVLLIWHTLVDLTCPWYLDIPWPKKCIVAYCVTTHNPLYKHEYIQQLRIRQVASDKSPLCFSPNTFIMYCILLYPASNNPHLDKRWKAVRTSKSQKLHACSLGFERFSCKDWFSRARKQPIKLIWHRCGNAKWRLLLASVQMEKVYFMSY